MTWWSGSSGAHPRACGENESSEGFRPELFGSSPRMRGKRPRRASQRRGSRLIPAHAGKTKTAALCLQGSQAHPRACGENVGSSILSAVAGGSSPRMRGKPGSRPKRFRKAGLIPAHAGKTPLDGLIVDKPTAHPRACGENTVDETAWNATNGSSPRMRGKPSCIGRRNEHAGLIPAHAGKTRVLRVTAISVPAHPRACGENMPCTPPLASVKGSSPRMRGKPIPQIAGAIGQGLIPAHAGKTLAPAVKRVAPVAHPRACGENEAGDEKGSTFDGSSPRMRGKHLLCFCHWSGLRLIPAHAGKTLTDKSAMDGSPAHPRACGENIRRVCRESGSSGSSPRMRGKLTGHRQASIEVRLIPAHAGKTGLAVVACA